MQRAFPALLFVFLSAPGPAPEFSTKVVGIADCDTITVLRDGRTQVKVCLNGIDAPESAQPFGSRSKQSRSDLVFAQTVSVQDRDVDRYGRTVADVLLADGRNVNCE